MQNLNILLPILLGFIITIPLSYLLIRRFIGSVNKKINSNPKFTEEEFFESEFTNSSIPQLLKVDIAPNQNFIFKNYIKPYLFAGIIISLITVMYSFFVVDGQEFAFIKALIFSFLLFSATAINVLYFYSFSDKLVKKISLFFLLTYIILYVYLCVKNPDYILGISLAFLDFLMIPILYKILSKLKKIKGVSYAIAPVGIFIVFVFMNFITILATDEALLKNIFNPFYDVMSFLGVEVISSKMFFFFGFLLFLNSLYISAIFIRILYNKKLLNDFLFISDFVWFFQLLHISYMYSGGENYGLVTLIYFILYKLILFIFQEYFKTRKENKKLLLLRVFALKEKSNAFFNRLKTYWSYKGSVQVIAGHDILDSVVDIDDLMSFVSGNIESRFNLDKPQIERNFSKIDLLPDYDSRYRINEMYCTNTTWKSVLHRVISITDQVIMDVRSFNKTNEGCSYEVKALFHLIPLSKIVFVMDKNTDINYFQLLITEAFEKIPVNSPNLNSSESVKYFMYNSDEDFDKVIAYFGE